MSKDSDADLMKRVQDGDSEAFGTLVERYRDSAVNIAYRFIGDRSNAEDLAQEAFVRVYEKRRSFDPSLNFSPWFYGILRNLCRDHLRSNAPRSDQLELLSAEENTALPAADDDGQQPAQQARRQELSRRVRTALGRLPERQRMAIILQHYEGLSYDEIGRVLECSRGTVDGLLSRARASIREWLGDYL